MNKGLIIYISLILCSWVVMCTLGYFFTDIKLWVSIIGVIGSTVAVIAVDGGLAHLSHKLQARINPFSRFFNVTKRQKDILSKMGVRKLKNYLPDLGILVKFPKNKIADPKSKEYVYAYILESCDGERGHIWGAFFGFIIVFIFPPVLVPLWYQYWLSVSIPVACVNFVLCLLPSIALRYNRYALTQIYKRLDSREQRTQENS